MVGIDAHLEVVQHLEHVFFFFLSFFFFFKDFIYSFMIDTHTQRQRKKQAPRREPNVGLDPRTPGPCLDRRQAPNCWATQGSPAEPPRDPSFFFFLKDFIYLFMKDTQRERQRHKQRKKQAPRREPNAGLDPGTPGSRPGPKAGAKPLSHPGIPLAIILL